VNVGVGGESVIVDAGYSEDENPDWSVDTESRTLGVKAGEKADGGGL
jgi:hypothetical protein